MVERFLRGGFATAMAIWWLYLWQSMARSRSSGVLFPGRHIACTSRGVKASTLIPVFISSFLMF